MSCLMTTLTLISTLNPVTGNINPTSVQTLIRPTFVEAEYSKTEQKIIRDRQTDAIQKVVSTTVSVKCGENVESETISWVKYGE